MDNMSKARAKLLIQHPFFASLIMSSPWIKTKDIPTAATNGKQFFYNPDFMDSLTLDENMGVQAHEAMHDALMHVVRLNGRNPRIWNMACDFSINHILIESGLKLPKGVLIDPKLGPNSADVNYEILMKMAEDNRKKRGDKQKGSGKPGDGEGEGDGEPEDGEGGGNGDGLKEDVLGRDIQEAPGGDEPGEMIKREQDIRQRVAQAANIARMAGNLPAGLARFIDQILNPQISWHEYLREYMTRMVKSEETWNKRNRRFKSIYLPTRFSEQMGEVGVIGDTSGSITNEDLNKVAAEVRAIANEVKPERIRMLWADTVVANEQVFEVGDELIFDAKGGGGTDMRVPLEHIEQYEPEVVILITDGYTPWPVEEPPYPLIVVCTTDAQVPVGQVIRLH